MMFIANVGKIMDRLVKYPLESGGFVYMEVSEPIGEEGLVKAGRGMPEEAAETFEYALTGLSPIANAIISKLIHMSIPPDEATVDFGVSLKADVGGLIIPKVGTEANFKVNLKWKRRE
jgi:hypothetical protein